MLNNGNGTFTGGPLDKIIILRDINTGRFHVCFMEEMPFPGPIKEVELTEIVRLKSKMHHTEGTATIDEAKVEMAKMKAKLVLPPENYDIDPVDWDGIIPIVAVVPNWRLGTPKVAQLDPVVESPSEPKKPEAKKDPADADSRFSWLEVD